MTLLPMLNLSSEFSEKNSFLFEGWIPTTLATIVLISITALTHIISMTASIFAYQMLKQPQLPLWNTRICYLRLSLTIYFGISHLQLAILLVTLILASGITIIWREWLTKKSEPKVV